MVGIYILPRTKDVSYYREEKEGKERGEKGDPEQRVFKVS